MDKSIVPVNQLAIRSSTCFEFSNPNPAEVVEIENNDTSVGTVKKPLEDLKLNHQFSENDLPEFFKKLINDRLKFLKSVYLELEESSCMLKFNQLYVRFERRTDNWIVRYSQVNRVIETVDPEGSIIDHLWFVLNNPKVKLDCLLISACKDSENRHSHELNSKKLESFLQSMLDTFDHPIRTSGLIHVGFNEDTFFSLLKNIKPVTLDNIVFDISWKEKGNYQKMKEIVELDQWKRAKSIDSPGVTPLEIEDLLHCMYFYLRRDHITPNDAQNFYEKFSNSTDNKRCTLSSRKKNFDIDAIIDFLRSQNDGAGIIEEKPFFYFESFHFTISKAGKLTNSQRMDKSIVPVNQLAVRSSTCYEFSNSNPAKVVEIEDDPVEVVERKFEDFKLNHQFDEKDVPKVFQDLMKNNKNSLERIFFHIHQHKCTMTFDEIEVILDKSGNDWMINYKDFQETIRTDNPEKSIIDHLWFVIKSPNTELLTLKIIICEDSCSEFESLEFNNDNSQKIDSEKLNTRLQSMLDSIKHQFQIYYLVCERLNEDAFLSMLKHVKPETLELIGFDIRWKEEGNYQKLKEIIETDQWKQAKKINSIGVLPALKIEDLLHFETFALKFDKIAPEYVSKVKELFIDSTKDKCCTLRCKNQDLDFDAYRIVLLPNSLSEKKYIRFGVDFVTYMYKIPNSPGGLSVTLDYCSITLEKMSNPAILILPL